MNFNYHTHTWRCNHAERNDEDYIRAAVEKGFTTLGFADHIPHTVSDITAWYRMRFDQVEEYVSSLSALREKYKGIIDIKIGFESEIYPSMFHEILTRLRPYPIDYLILGQHYLYDESSEENNSGRETADVARLDDYINTLLYGISCGSFSYIAHPDIFNFKGDEEIYHDRVTKLCLAAKEKNVPLEINMPGLVRPRHYPTERFFRIAGEVQAPVIFGCDAHKPSGISEAPIAEAEAFAARCGVILADKLVLRDPFACL